jgi:hypothetical protein
MALLVLAFVIGPTMASQICSKGPSLPARLALNYHSYWDEVSGSSTLVGSLWLTHKGQDLNGLQGEASYSLKGSLRATLGAQDYPQQS